MKKRRKESAAIVCDVGMHVSPLHSKNSVQICVCKLFTFFFEIRKLFTVHAMPGRNVEALIFFLIIILRP
jgi:hypothetical protein